MVGAEGELVSKLQAPLHSGDLRIAASLPDAAVLARKLQDFRVGFPEAGNATFNAREGVHDDLVLALALAVFGLSRPEPRGRCAREVGEIKPESSRSAKRGWLQSIVRF